MENLNKVIRKRWTKDDIGMEPIINAAIDSTPGVKLEYKIPLIKDGQETDATTDISFINQDLLEYALNNQGSHAGGDDPGRGSPMWLGTEETTSFMDNENFDSYYANVLYQDYQPYYNDGGEVEWLIDYDDNGNEIDRVKPWNMADSGVFIPARDKLTSMALQDTSSMPTNLMLKIKDYYKGIIENQFNGDLGNFLKAAEFSDFGPNPYKYMEGANPASQSFFTKATEYAAAQTGVNEEEIVDEETDEGDPPVEPPIIGSMQTAAVNIGNAFNNQAGWGAYKMPELIKNMNNLTFEMDVDGTMKNVPISMWLENLKVGDEGISVSIKPVGKKKNEFTIKIKPRKGEKMSNELAKTFADNPKWWGYNNSNGYETNIDIPGDAPTDRKANEIWNLLLNELNKIGVNVQGKRK